MAVFNINNLAAVYHPGETLSEKLSETGMSIKEFAVRTSKPEKTIFAIINGSSSITSDMAVAFESVTHIPAHFWMNAQQAYDEYIARKKREQIITDSIKWAEMFPYEEMAKSGWIETTDIPAEKVKNLFSFFEISTVKGWEDYYFNQRLKVAFHISLFGTINPYAISAWLRRGEQQAAGIELNVRYSANLLKDKISLMKDCLSSDSRNYATGLQKICADAGIKLIYTPALSKIPITGCARWINNFPCIQLAGQDKNNDTFRYSFFHEIGHILLHGKKDVFLENIDYADKHISKEKEADIFAEII